MKNNNFLILLLLVLYCCNLKVYSAVSKIDYNLTAINVIDSDESKNLIENSYDFELKHNEIFQNDLQIKSLEYYDSVIETFVDEETGFLKLLGELSDRIFKSESERRLLWKLKIERYFRTTSFLAFIRNEVSIYTDGVNNQRKEGISKILDVKHSSDLNLPIVKAKPFNTKDHTVKKIVGKINEEINDQLADISLGLIPEIIILLLSVIGLWKTKHLGCLPSIIITVILAIFFMWRSYVRQNEMKNILKSECHKTLNNIKINYLEQLNNNTMEYYTKLQKTINETNN